MGNKSKKVSIFVGSILNSLWLFGFCMVVMLFSLMFYAGDMNEILRFALGIVMSLPLCVLFYTRGNIVATKEFSSRNAAISPDKTVNINKVPFGYGLVMITPYLLLPLTFVILGNLFGILPLQSIALYICLPVTICFKAFGIMTTLTMVNWISVLIVGAFLLVMSSMYFLGFFKTLIDKERSFKEMLNEVKFNSKL